MVLKKQLTDDWEFINQKGCLVRIPKKLTVSEILKEYLNTKKQRCPADKIIVEIVEGKPPFSGWRAVASKGSHMGCQVSDCTLTDLWGLSSSIDLSDRSMSST